MIFMTLCFCFNTLCLVLFLGKCVCLHLYWKNIDCIYKYIYHLSGFVSLAFAVPPSVYIKKVQQRLKQSTHYEKI